jgi:AraC family cel operon transcriptional repressor
VDARIRILLRVIEEHGGTLQMTSKQIGSLLGLGEARVLRLFNTEVGKTLRRHSLEVRMARAAELLKNSVLPIKRIAFDCGYSLVTNFYRDFKRIHGISPMQMRLMRMNIQLSQKQSALAPRPHFDHPGAANGDPPGSLYLAPSIR